MIQKITSISTSDEHVHVNSAENAAVSNVESSKELNLNHYPNLDLVMDIPVDIQVILGSTSIPVASLMNLARGAVVTLDKKISDPVDIVVNGRLVARGEVIIMNDDSSRFGVTLTELIA